MSEKKTTLAEIEKKVADWANSPEGARQLKETAERARRNAETVGKQAAITSEMLNQRVTI
jgi:hypothetical protein